MHGGDRTRVAADVCEMSFGDGLGLCTILRGWRDVLKPASAVERVGVSIKRATCAWSSKHGSDHNGL